MNKKSILDTNVAGKKCLVRCDFNVPMKDGVITDENRINGALPTIKYLIEQGAKVILCSHMGKPHNIFTPGFSLDKKEKKAVEALPVEEQAAAKAEFIKKAAKDATKYTLAPVAKRLSELLGQEVKFASDVVGESANTLAKNLKNGEVMMLENTRFEAGEEKRDEELCKKRAALCDGEVFVNDAFGTAHRSHATTAAIAEYGLVKESVCGFLIEKELRIMGGALENPERPFVAVLGGAKVADKLNVIANLLEKCDALIIGGGMSYTFSKALGKEVGTSLVDDEKLGYCKDMLDKAAALGKKIYLPIDTVVTSTFPDPIDAEISVENVDVIPADKMGLDIGVKTAELYASVVKTAKTVIWNGPMGVFENPILAKGTIAVAKALAEATDATTIIGGGDSAAAVAQLGFADKMTHISTGGGASLELFEGKKLPGIECLDNK
ncbi:MAG: phosphoglycerate kinase [Clostridia bacterium]|nr:phosphoglycerate kinase [Clostridia bacterium]